MSVEVTINSIKITGDEIEAVVKIKDEFRYQNFTSMDIARVVQERVAREAVDEYLKNHLQEIMSKIDQQQILNMIVLNAAKRITRD
jgi:hypothetical protein